VKCKRANTDGLDVFIVATDEISAAFLLGDFRSHQYPEQISMRAKSNH
jgi:hypothetical protein